MKIIVTTGDTNGIGLEVFFNAILRFDKEYSSAGNCDISIAGNPRTISNYFNATGIKTEVTESLLIIGNRSIPIIDSGVESQVKLGELTTESGKHAFESIKTAINSTIDGRFNAMVTMPISKEAVHKAGMHFPGHTEFIASKCFVKRPIMILCTRKVRVALATIHLPLREVQYSVTVRDLVKRGTILHHTLRNDFGIDKPKIAMLGLNPHAGEHGDIGNEENEILKPAIGKIAIRGIDIDGPHPADGFFAHGAYQKYDAIIAMYHDQGLIPLKMIAGGAGVNYTAGLPIVRTSPDHGTAFDIAGKGIADESSALESLETAYEIAKRRNESNKVVISDLSEDDIR